MDPSPSAVTTTVVSPELQASWEAMLPCHNCGHSRASHLADGMCLFQPTFFEPIPCPGIELISVWTLDIPEPIKPHRPYPKQSEYDKRKERRLQMKAQRGGR